MSPQSAVETQSTGESLDCRGAADHDVPFEFGRLPRALAPFPFSTRQLARLMVLRSKVEAGLFGADDEILLFQGKRARPRDRLTAER